MLLAGEVHYLLETYLDDPGDITDDLRLLYKAAKEGDYRSIITISNKFYKPLNFKETDKCREDIVKILFKYNFIHMGQLMLTEVPSGFGYIDNLLITEKHAYVFEFKIDGKSADDALKQANDRKYAWSIAGERTLHLIGIDYRSEYQQIVSFTHQLYGSDEIEKVVLIDITQVKSGRLGRKKRK